jgi:membrane complex biogenesis BtpA family protein
MGKKDLDIFKNYPAVVGVVHLPALPGSPAWKGNIDEVLEFALHDAMVLERGGVDGIIVENFWDAPFTRGSVEPITVAAMTQCVFEIRKKVDVALGVNVLRNDAVAALSIAAVTGAQFIRVNVLTHAMVTDQGIIQGCSYELSQLKARLGSDICIMADVMVKHGFPPGVIDIGTMARDMALRGGADILIVSGSETGTSIDMADIRKVRQAVPGFPIASGSGVTDKNVAELLEYSEVIMVGTWFKRDGTINNPVDKNRVQSLVKIVRSHQG